MATYKLIPSSLTAEGTGTTITNETNAYTGTSSTTAAGVEMGASSGTDYPPIYLGGFDFSVIPSNEYILSMVVKVKCEATFVPGSATLVSASDGVALSETKSVSINSSEVYTLSITAQPEAIRQYADTLCIKLTQYTGFTMLIYGAELDIVTGRMDKSKVIYGNETLIDLTGDTATEADVASGKIFHLANGSIGIGTLSQTIKTKTASSSTQSIGFTGLPSAPERFALVPTAAPNPPTSSRPKVLALSYDGSTKYALIGTTSSTPYRIVSNFSHTYTSGTLTITFSSSTSYYFGGVSYKLFYL